MGVPIHSSPMGEKTLGAVLTSMQRQATTYMTSYAYNKLQGSGQGFDMRGLVGVMLSGGVTETLLQQSGFVNDPNNPGSWLEQSINDVVGVLGGGFADAAFEQAFSGEMNPERVFALSIGRLAGKQSGYALKSAFPGPATVGASYTQETQLAEDLTALQTRTQPRQHQSAMTYSSPFGQQHSVEDAIESAPLPTPTPREKQLHNQIASLRDAEAMHGVGNPVKSKATGNMGSIHRGVDETERVESMDVRRRTAGDELLPIYDYPRKPQGSGNARASLTASRYEAYLEEEEEEIYYKETRDALTGEINGYTAYKNGRPLLDSSGTAGGAHPPLKVVIASHEAEESVIGPVRGAKFKAPVPQQSSFDIGPPKPYELDLGGDTIFESMTEDGASQIKRVAQSSALRGDALSDLYEYGAKNIKFLGKTVGGIGTLSTLSEAYYDYYQYGNYRKAGELVTRAIGSGAGGGFGVWICSPAAAIPGVITACGITGAAAGDWISAGIYNNVFWPTYEIYRDWRIPSSVKYSYTSSDFYGPVKPVSNYHPHY